MSDIGETAIAYENAIKNDALDDTLDLMSKCFNDDEYKLCAEALKSNMSINYLMLGETNIGPDVFKCFVDVLLEKSFINLQINNCELGDKGAIHLANLLTNNSTIVEINCGQNQFTTEGLKVIGKALEVNKTLKIINFHDNNVGKEGAEALGKSLEKNSSIEELNFSCCELQNNSIKLLAISLAKMQSLKCVDFKLNKIDEEGELALEKYLTGKASW